MRLASRTDWTFSLMLTGETGRVLLPFANSGTNSAVGGTVPGLVSGA